MKGAYHHILCSGAKANVSHAHSAPSLCDREENFGQFLDERRLLLRREHQVPITKALRGERGEYSASHAKVRRAHVGTLFSSGEAEGNSAKVICVHQRL